MLNIFKNTDTVKTSFLRVRTDMDALRQNLTEWILHFSRRQDEQEERIARLEKRIFEMESERYV